MRRVLRDDGYLDILMIAKDDGAEFKKSIVAALKKHLSFKQIMGTANLVQRARADQVYSAFSAFDEGYNIVVEEYRDVVYGTFDEHMKWWSARSTPGRCCSRGTRGYRPAGLPRSSWAGTGRRWRAAPRRSCRGCRS